MAQTTWRLRVPELQLLEHWGPPGWEWEERTSPQRERDPETGWGVPIRQGEGGRCLVLRVRPKDRHMCSLWSETQGTGIGQQVWVGGSTH